MFAAPSPTSQASAQVTNFTNMRHISAIPHVAQTGNSINDITLDETISCINDKQADENAALANQLNEEKQKRQKLSKLYSAQTARNEQQREEIEGLQDQQRALISLLQ